MPTPPAVQPDGARPLADRREATAKHRGLMPAWLAAAVSTTVLGAMRLVRAAHSLVVGGQAGTYLLANADLDEETSTWTTLDPTQPQTLWQISPNATGDTIFSTSPAGAVPAWTQRAVFQAPGANFQIKAPTGQALLSSINQARLANNAYYDGANWLRYNTASPAFLLSVESGVVYGYYAAAGANPIAWTGPLTLHVAPATDANGWAVTYLGTGKRMWNKQFTVTMPAAAAADIILNTPLPVGLATVGGAYWYLNWESGAGNGFDVNLGLDFGTAATALTVAAGTIDGAALNAKHASIIVYAQAVEK